MTEAEFQRQVTALAEQAGGMVYHTRDSRGSAAGFPDLIICLPEQQRVLFRELKVGTAVTEPQARWLAALVACGQDAGVWGPWDLESGRVARELGTGAVILQPEEIRRRMGLACDAASGLERAHVAQNQGVLGEQGAGGTEGPESPPLGLLRERRAMPDLSTTQARLKVAARIGYNLATLADAEAYGARVAVQALEQALEEAQW